MVYTSKEAELCVQHDDWLDLVKYHQVESIYLPGGTHLSYNCDEAQTKCLSDHPPGIARSQCCLRQLADGVQTIMRECEEAGLQCEVTDGTILGTLKFETSLPWEIDADIEIEANNVSTFNSRVASKLKSLGYSVAASKGYHTMYQLASRWMLELFHISSLGSSRLKASGVPVTRVSLDGTYITTCESPGLLGRNRYGHEIYQHVNHWRKAGASSSWAFYKPGEFAACTKPGHHSCLDQFRADGSTQFNIEKLEP
ncbi:uncharacterized protein [Watersipora subatra]|uniref:uncharacterized protein n=1 Tax=Watersipora subatra TaxID=2589382 RepID=UPI00355B8DAF